MGVEVQGRVDEYLLRLDSALTRRGADAGKRREVGVSVRNQIMAKLSQRERASSAHGAAHLSAGDAEAVLAELGPPEKIAMETVTPPPVVARYTGPSKLSMTAVLGLVWALMFPVMLFLSRVTVEPKPGESPPWWLGVVQVVVVPMGWASIVATPVLGLLALDRIRKSNGRLYGLSLALFVALVFPLLALNALVFWLCWQLNQQLIDQASLPASVSTLINQILPTVICVLGDYFIAARAWMAVSEE